MLKECSYKYDNESLENITNVHPEVMLFLQVSERTNLCSVAKVNLKDVGPVSLLNTVSIGRSATRASRLSVCHFNKYFKKDCEIMDVKSAKHSE